MSGLVVKNSNELWFNNTKLSTSTGTKGLYIDNNRNLFFNGAKIASGNLSNPKGLHLINNELAYDGINFGTELNVLIRSLFANNEQGFAFDFNDLSTMYQDAAGTIPVTGVGQPVGLVLDKSKGLVRGNLICGNSELKNPNYWTTVGAGWSFSNDKIVANNADKVYVGTVNKTIQGMWYEVTVDVTVISGQVLLPYDGSGGNILSVSTSGTYKRVFCSTNNQLVIGYGYTFTGSINSVTIKELPGNHATQSTSAKRPILQQNATTGAYYLSFDGVNDFLATASFPAMGLGTTVFSGSLCNKTATSAIAARNTGGYLYQKSGSTQIQSNNNPLQLATNGNAVTTVLYDSSGTGVTLRANRQVVSKPMTERGFNNGNPLAIGAFSQNGGVPFQGNIYSVIGINRVATTIEISNTENVIAKNVGVTL